MSNDRNCINTPFIDIIISRGAIGYFCRIFGFWLRVIIFLSQYVYLKYVYYAKNNY